MEIKEASIEGLYIVKPDLFFDDRGYFTETYHRNKYVGLGLTDVFVQDNLSLSKKNVIRGLHFQVPPYAQGKLVSVLSGSVLDIAVDLRKDSPSYRKWFSIVLSGENHLQFYIPEGFAHGFAALEDNTLFSYKCTNVYSKLHERCICFDDPDLNIDWMIENPIVSDKDREGCCFGSFVSCF